MKAQSKVITKNILTAFGLAIWVCGILFLTQLVLSFILGWLFNILPFHISSAVAQTIFSLISYTLAIIIIFKVPKVFYKFWTKKHSKKTEQNTTKLESLAVTKSDLGLNELPTWTDIGLAPVGLIVYALLASLLTALFSIFPWFNIAEAQDVGFNTMVLTSDRIFAFITLVIIAPIAEELIFRGYLYRKIKDIFYKKDSQILSEKAIQKSVKKRKKFNFKNREFTAIVIAALITSLAFGIMHGQWNVGVNVFAMSIVLCIMREITGSIYAGILLHMLKNAIAFYLLYVAVLGF